MFKVGKKEDSGGKGVKPSRSVVSETYSMTSGMRTVNLGTKKSRKDSNSKDEKLISLVQDSISRATNSITPKKAYFLNPKRNTNNETLDYFNSGITSDNGTGTGLEMSHRQFLNKRDANKIEQKLQDKHKGLLGHGNFGQQLRTGNHS